LAICICASKARRSSVSSCSISILTWTWAQRESWASAGGGGAASSQNALSASAAVSRHRPHTGLRIDQRLAFGPGKRPSALDKKLGLHGQLANLGVQLGDALLGVLDMALTVGKQLGGVLKQLLLPVGDLARVDLELLGQLGQRLVTSDGLQGDLGLEGRGVVTTGSLHGHCSSHGQA
jgi:hypothetical protein